MAQKHRQDDQRSPDLLFLKTVSPFSAFSEDQIIKVSRFLAEKFYPKGTLILKEGKTDIEALHIIKSGGASCILRTLKTAKFSVFFLKSFCARYIHSAHSEIHGK